MSKRARHICCCLNSSKRHSPPMRITSGCRPSPRKRPSSPMDRISSFVTRANWTVWGKSHGNEPMNTWKVIYVSTMDCLLQLRQWLIRHSPV
jgi:hypothetical protein